MLFYRTIDFKNLNQLIIYRSLHILKFLEEFFIFNIIKPDLSTGMNNRHLTFNMFSYLIIAIVSLSLSLSLFLFVQVY